MRELPATYLKADGRALRRFTQVTVRNRSGRVVFAGAFPFCPNGGERQRVNDEGPVVPRYPELCSSWFPFARGVVWGLETGWASAALGGDPRGDYGAPFVKLPAGRLTATVRIAPRFVQAFGIAEADATTTVALRVKRVRRGGGGAEPPIGIPMPLGRHLAHAGAGVLRAAAVPDVADPDPETLPDVAALPAWNIRLEPRRGREYLAFASSPWNAGPGPLVVEGFRRRGEDVMDAYQYFHDADGAVVGRAPVGTMEYDPRRGHNHWHFLQFVRYTVVDTASREVVRSRKQAFCLAPTDAVDLTLPRAAWNPWAAGLGSMCGGPRSIWAREVLAAGWADTYDQSVPGQSFDVTGLPNGRYSVVVHVNPLGALHDRDASNDTAARTITLRGKPGARRVTVAPWHGIEN